MSLPSNFVWGFGTASYQIEGATEDDGRGPSIWDAFCRIPNKIADGTDGRTACDSYHRTAEDIALLKEYGAKAYRFSVSWSRIIPLGGRNDPVNQKGLEHYQKFVNDLSDAGIIPLVTLYQWDLPETLHERYGGPLNKKEFVQDFANYARVVFSALGPKVKHWTTFTEPHNIAATGYNIGSYAPGRSSDRRLSPEGDGSLEPWIMGHSILVAHGTVARIYRQGFNSTGDGKIGITLNGLWPEPWNHASEQDHRACQRFLEFTVGWFADPIYFGHYPRSMIEQLGRRLPEWTSDEIALVHGSNDFFALDYYTATFIKNREAVPEVEDYLGNVDLLPQNSQGQNIGPETDSAWLRPCAKGLRRLLNWIHDTYNKPEIQILENGTSVKGEDDLPMEQILHDDFRCEFYRDHIMEMVRARVEDDINVMGYMAWSLMDNFEWNDGFRVRFGVTYVDYHDDMKRYPKKSARLIARLFRDLVQN